MKRCTTPCKDCPFRKTNGWIGTNGGEGVAEFKIMALESIEENFHATGNEVFSCHMKNPDNTVFSLRRMINHDCAGYKMMKKNMLKPGTHPEIVNEFNETGPTSFDLRYWARKTGYTSKLNLI
jgi:hypothetical protein